MRNWKVLLLLIVVIAVSEVAFGQGCSQCKLLSEQGSGANEVDEAAFGSNINYGILYLMIIPYILLFALFHKRIFAFFRKLAKK